MFICGLWFNSLLSTTRCRVDKVVRNKNFVKAKKVENTNSDFKKNHSSHNSQNYLSFISFVTCYYLVKLLTDGIVDNLNNLIQGLVSSVNGVITAITNTVGTLQALIAALLAQNTPAATGLATLLQAQLAGVVTLSQGVLNQVLSQLTNIQGQLTTSIGTLTGTAQAAAQTALNTVNTLMASVQTLLDQLKLGTILNVGAAVGGTVGK